MKIKALFKILKTSYILPQITYEQAKEIAKIFKWESFNRASFIPINKDDEILVVAIDQQKSMGKFPNTNILIMIAKEHPPAQSLWTIKSKKTKKDCFSMIAKIFFTIIKKYINTEGMLGLQDISPIMNNIENDISTQTFSEENFNALNNLLNYNQNNPIYDAYTRDWIRAIIAIYKAMSNGSFQAYEEAFNKSMASCPEIAQNINTIKNIILSFMIKEIWNGETK